MPTAREIFQHMPDRFRPEKAGDLKAVVQFDLSGEGGGQWVVTIQEGTLEVQEGRVDNPTTTIRMAADDYVALTQGKLNPVTAAMTGKIRVEGNMGVALRMQTLFG